MICKFCKREELKPGRTYCSQECSRKAAWERHHRQFVYHPPKRYPSAPMPAGWLQTGMEEA